jgi:hypothetical protein
MYFEIGHDVNCVVHAINNCLGYRLLNPTLTAYLLRDKYDPDSGYNPKDVFAFVARKYGIYFRRVPHANDTGRFVLCVKKPTYNHCLALVHGVLLDNEEKIHVQLGAGDKLASAYELII